MSSVVPELGIAILIRSWWPWDRTYPAVVVVHKETE
jgi:hypothetical protein